MSITTGNSTELNRANLWSSNIKQVLEDEMQAQQYVSLITDFPDGDTFNIPSIGQRVAKDYTENDPIDFTPLDTGNFTFTIDKYIQDGIYITDKKKQDSFYTNQLIATFEPQMSRALMTDFETTTWAAPEVGVSANSGELIDGIRHRFVGGDAGKMELQDFIYANYALKKANVPMQGLVAIVDPSVEVTINSLTNIVNVSNNPRWEGIVETGMGSGLKFIKNIYGFDVYTSNYLADVTDSALLDTAGANAQDFSSVPGKANLFFSMATESFVGAWREMPSVEFERNTPYRRDEYSMTARYAVKTYRPENMVVIPTVEAV